MSEDIAKPAKEKKYWEDRVVGVLKWLTILAVILFILLTVLSRLGGNSDVLKGSIEDYLTDATPYSASVTTLNNMNFFPDIIIDVQGVELREGADGTGEAAIRVEAAKVVIPFFDMLFSPGDFKDINVSNITARAGSLHAKPVTLEYLRLKDENENAGLELKGALGQTAFSGLVGVSASGASGKRTYSLGDEKSVNFDIGRLKLEGTLRNAALGGLKFENVTLSHGETKALRGNFDFKSSGDDMSLKGQARIEPGKSQLDFDIDVKSQEAAKRVTGRVDSGLIKVSDFNESGAFMKAVNRLSAILGSGEKKPLDLSGLDVDVAMDIKNINIDKLTVGSISAPLSIKDKVLKIGPLKGDIVKGALGGDIKIDASKSPAKMNNKITIRKLDYAYLQTQLAGKAEIEGAGDILIDLSSEGTSLDALMDNLSGKAGFVGGRAKMRSGLLNIWGGGLLKAIMPKFKESDDLNVNCIVVNMDVEQLKARSDAVFLDANSVTLHGEGTYDFKNDQLEMVLEPKTKNIAIGDISSAVNVSGPISNLKTSPNVFDLGKKVGGLLLGAVNPAFYAVTLADLNLSDKHPCKQFVIEQEVLPPPPKKEEAKEEAPAAEAAPEGEAKPKAGTPNN